MATFAYLATGNQGRRQRGTLTADTPRAARDQLRKQGLMLEKLKAVSSNRKVGSHRRVSQGQVSRFLSDLQILLGVGTPLVGALDVLIPDYARMRDVLLDVRERVISGSSLAAALQAHAACFDSLTCSMIAAGEQGGRLEESLQRLNEYRDRAGRFRNQLISAMLYPVIILVMCVVVGVVLMTLVLPPLLQTLSESGKPLPPLTRGVKVLSDLLTGYWWQMLVAAGALGAAVVWIVRWQRDRIDRAILWSPVLGMILRKQNAARLGAMLSSLLSAGLPLIEAMRLCRSGSISRAFAHDLEVAELAIEAGRDLGAALPAQSVFPPALRHVFAVGQESGQLPEVLLRLASDYDREVEQSVARLMAILQPALIAVLAGVVGLIALATILPIMEAGHVL
jgi:general secretion pathway protein F